MSSKWVWSFAIAMLWAGSASAQNFDRAAPGQDKVAESPWFAVHGQATVVVQGHDAFRSPYRGDQSLDPAARAAETADLTLYAGLKPWRGAEIWINPEIDQGFGLSNTLGVAGYVSGEAYKVGQSTPYLKLPRLFLRQTVDLGGERETVDSDLNVLGGARSSDRLVLTVGKFGVPDVFDTNTYAHDPRQDFLNSHSMFSIVILKAMILTSLKKQVSKLFLHLHNLSLATSFHHTTQLQVKNNNP
jgi:high affinity Mn2+ porin